MSFFSSSVAAIGGWILSVGTWLSQSFPMQLWVLVAVTIGMGFLAATGIWAIYEANTELKATQTELSKAYAKARDANVELNSVDAKLNAANKELSAANSKLIATRNKLDTANMELVIAQATIADLQTPKEQSLTEHQRIVLAAIMYYDNSGEKCYVKGLSERIEFTMVQADGAVDVLVKRKLVQEYYVNGHRVVSLSPNGREYVLHPDFDMSYLPL